MSSSTETCEVVLPLNARSPDSIKSVCDCSEFNSSRIVRTDLSLFPWQLFDQRVGNSFNRAEDVGSPYFRNLSRLATTYRIPLAYSHTVFQYAINNEELRKRRSFLAEILLRFPGVEVSKS